MKGVLPKRIAPSQLQCSKCTSFVDDDPDVYYCVIDRPEFPGLCDFYELRGQQYKVLDEDDGELY